MRSPRTASQASPGPGRRGVSSLTARRAAAALADPPVDFDSAYAQGFARVAACTLHTVIADPHANAEAVLSRPAAVTATESPSRSSPSSA